MLQKTVAPCLLACNRQPDRWCLINGMWNSLPCKAHENKSFALCMGVHMHVCVHGCVAVCGCVCLCMVVCLCVAVCGCVCLCVAVWVVVGSVCLCVVAWACVHARLACIIRFKVGLKDEDPTAAVVSNNTFENSI